MNEQKYQSNETLLEQFKQGDKEAGQQLVCNNMGLVYSICKRFANRTTDIEDLYQIGAIGLMKAVDLFDTSFGVKFSTYAVPMIIGEIKRYLRDFTTIKVSRSYKELATKVNYAREVLANQLGREPDISQIANYLGEDREEIVFCLEAVATPQSLSTPIGKDDSDTLADVIGDEGIKEDKLVESIALKEVIKKLPGNEKKIITLRYFQNKTQMEVAKELGISQVSVSRTEKKILLKMRRMIS